MQELDEWLERVYKADGDRATLDRLYDEWADQYDQHLWASGNPYIAIAAGFAGRHIPSFEAAILDAGCGTGYLSRQLARSGARVTRSRWGGSGATDRPRWPCARSSWGG